MSLVYFLSLCATATLASAHISVPLASTAAGHVFVVNVTVGTPPQPLSLLLSPSSPHTWVPNAADAMPCRTGFDSSSFYPAEGPNSACRWGAFTATTSSTLVMAEQRVQQFEVAYTDTINVRGLNMTDKFKMGDIELDGFSMGLVSTTSNEQWIGMLGLGNDATSLFPGPRLSTEYRPNLIDRLVSSGKINSPGYSIWLNSEATSGTLLLGAVDKSRYEGDLVRLSTIQPYNNFPSAFAVNLTGANVDDTFKYDGPSIAASVSPSETFSYLPHALAEGIMAASGGSWDTNLQRITIPCDAGSKKSKTNIRFQLQGPNGPVLNVRLADLVVPQDVTRWEVAYATLNNLGRNICLFGVQKYRDLHTSGSNGPQYNLGSSLLRRTYMVLDAANKDVAFAPAKQVITTEQPDIVPFEKQGARIPASRLVCSPGEDCASKSDDDDDDDVVSGTTTTKSSNNWKKIVIGVVVPIGALAILAPIAYILFMRRRKRQANAREWSAREKHSQSQLNNDDENFEEDEFGVKVTVSVATKVSNRMLKPPPSPSPSGSGSEMSLSMNGSGLGSGAPRRQVWE
ncbi:aspartic peptidase domain-containing protein [Cladorrhinum sp. PSN259]|nr:aspartic peptidase domain-containing protein [Cladorrhinum sp. PSN259]